MVLERVVKEMTAVGTSYTTELVLDKDLKGVLKWMDQPTLGEYMLCMMITRSYYMVNIVFQDTIPKSL